MFPEYKDSSRAASSVEPNSRTSVPSMRLAFTGLLRAGPLHFLFLFLS
jgi:hypothetical protein